MADDRPGYGDGFPLRDDAATLSKSNEHLLSFDSNQCRRTTVAVNEILTSVDQNHSPQFRNV